MSLLETTKLCEEIVSRKIKISGDTKNRPADMSVHISDNRQVYNDFDWKPKKKPQEILQDIFIWIRDNEKNLIKTLWSE